MDGQRLVPCVNCRHGVSPSAGSCPKCGEVAFRGLRCCLCGELGRRAEILNRGAPRLANGAYLHDRYVHTKCAERFFATIGDVKCGDCGKSLSGLLKGTLPAAVDAQPVCRECGSRNPLKCGGACAACGLPMYPKYQQVRYADVLLSEYAADSSHIPWHHEKCAIV
jgi:ribosomal protein L37E